MAEDNTQDNQVVIKRIQEITQREQETLERKGYGPLVQADTSVFPLGGSRVVPVTQPANGGVGAQPTAAPSATTPSAGTSSQAGAIPDTSAVSQGGTAVSNPVPDTSAVSQGGVAPAASANISNED